ncbi:hypothetical protein [Hydrogenophaga sp. RWCD_12]|uniref:hypothetical protein n=1 Tax=Hydrogenophaga sp. RWCD_12 TaxID=3391190 RepID=UPI003984C05E
MRSNLSNSFPAMPRRTAMRLVASGAMGLALAACGGGGGDGSSGDVQALRSAYANLRNGMTVADVEALVGFPANSWRTTVDLRWIVDGVTLYVGFTSTGSPRIITDAKLTEADGVNSKQRSFDY